MDERLARGLADQFDELGLRFLEPIDLTELPAQDTVSATLGHEQGQARYRVGYSDTLTFSSVDWAKPHYAGGEPLLLLGPRVTERSAQMFRQLDINFVDQAGNAFITFDGVHIDVRGRRAPHRTGARATRMTRGGVNLFSTKRSQVIFVLLSWPEVLNKPVRDLAAMSRVSLGQAQETLELLMQYGFLDERKQLLPHQRGPLLDQWVAAYPSGLGSATKGRRFTGEWIGLESGETAVFVSGEAAVPQLLRPETAVLYTDELPVELIRVNRWRRNDEQPNILLRRKFWDLPHSPEMPGVYDAPWLLVYADLLASNDSRQREVAQQLLEEQR